MDATLSSFAESEYLRDATAAPPSARRAAFAALNAPHACVRSSPDSLRTLPRATSGPATLRE